MANLRFGHAGYTLASHLFRQFLVELDIDTAEAEAITIRRFYEWGRARKKANAAYPCPMFPDKDALKSVYDLDDETIDFIDSIFDNPFEACAQLHNWWPLLTLAARGPVKNKITAISLAAAVQFEDGHIAHFPMPLVQQVEPYSDGMICSLWRGQLSLLVNLIRSKGFDEVYKQVVKSGLKTANLEVCLLDESSDIAQGTADDDSHESDAAE